MRADNVLQKKKTDENIDDITIYYYVIYSLTRELVDDLKLSHYLPTCSTHCDGFVIL